MSSCNLFVIKAISLTYFYLCCQVTQGFWVRSQGLYSSRTLANASWCPHQLPFLQVFRGEVEWITRILQTPWVWVTSKELWTGENGIFSNRQQTPLTFSQEGDTVLTILDNNQTFPFRGKHSPPPSPIAVFYKHTWEDGSYHKFARRCAKHGETHGVSQPY